MVKWVVIVVEGGFCIVLPFFLFFFFTDLHFNISPSQCGLHCMHFPSSICCNFYPPLLGLKLGLWLPIFNFDEPPCLLPLHTNVLLSVLCPKSLLRGLVFLNSKNVQIIAQSCSSSHSVLLVWFVYYFLTIAFYFWVLTVEVILVFLLWILNVILNGSAIKCVSTSWY